MQPWSKITHYAGFDWARDHHEVVIVNPSGKIVADFQVGPQMHSVAEQLVAVSPGIDRSGKIVADFQIEHTAQSGASF